MRPFLPHARTKKKTRKNPPGLRFPYAAGLFYVVTVSSLPALGDHLAISPHTVLPSTISAPPCTQDSRRAPTPRRRRWAKLSDSSGSKGSADARSAAISRRSPRASGCTVLTILLVPLRLQPPTPFPSRRPAATQERCLRGLQGGATTCLLLQVIHYCWVLP